MLWQVPVCALIAVLPATVAVTVIYRAGKQPPRVFDLWAPSWRIINPYWLLGYRGLVFLVMSWLLTQIVLIDGAFAFYFYTQWTFTLVIIYFVIGTIISAHGCWTYSRTHITESEAANGFLKSELVNSDAPTMTVRGNTDREGTRLPNRFEGKLHEKRAGFWGYVMQIIYQISAGAVILTDVVFWLLLVPTMSEHLRLDFVMICMHSLNAVFLLIDTAVNRLPFPWFGMAYFVLWSCSYLTFQWVLHACGLNWWPYPFMELSTPWAPLWYLAIALVHIPCYGIYYLTAKVKNSFFSKLFPNLYIQSY
ncbi:protein rolling stone-like [Phalaenopsis equestris]|uniref:protein rolling stone-like n=1 Tax=Phalaenopsis equestris TaxID=78828 RepID=UPI0009E58CC9|nr:protein rolling stone-like [Phalaenopsis equestris]